MSSEDKPDDQVKPLTPLPNPSPPPQKKKIQDVTLVTPQKYILNAQGAYNHSAGVHTGLSIRTRDEGFPMATKSMTPVYLYKKRKRVLGKDIPSCSISRLLIGYTRQLEITAAALNIHIFFLPLSLTNLFDFATKAKATNQMHDKVINIDDNNLK